MPYPAMRARALPVLSAAFVALVFAVVPPPSYAVLYKCVHQGAVSYSDQPCEGLSRQLAVAPPPNAHPAAQSPDAALLAREKAELSQLQNLREQRERQDQQIRDLAVRGQVAKQKKCRMLALQSKWAREDADGAVPHSKASATRKARRSLEKWQSECS